MHVHCMVGLPMCGGKTCGGRGTANKGRSRSQEKLQQPRFVCFEWSPWTCRQQLSTQVPRSWGNMRQSANISHNKRGGQLEPFRCLREPQTLETCQADDRHLLNMVGELQRRPSPHLHIQFPTNNWYKLL